jgi:hypothetical protein
MKLPWIYAISLVPALLWQTGSPNAFQQNEWIGFPGGGTVTIHNLRPDGQTGPVAGRPFTATEVRHTVQTLTDGTNVNHTDTSTFSGDAQGRMRSESPRRILIYDPVAGFTYNLSPSTRTYEKYPIKPGTGSTSIAVVGDSTWVKSAAENGPHMPIESVQASNGLRAFHAEPVRNPITEDLPIQTVNGIAAKGSRITITIPAGTLGNDRDVKVVSERWYSDVLQVLVKTVNSDPRFGVTTYDLTNIVQGSPDPSLFQIPTDFRPQLTSNRE